MSNKDSMVKFGLGTILVALLLSNVKLTVDINNKKNKIRRKQPIHLSLEDKLEVTKENYVYETLNVNKFSSIEIRKYQEKIHQITSNIEKNVINNNMDDEKKAEQVFTYLWNQGIIKKADKSVGELNKLLDHSIGNCLSISILYTFILDYLNIPYKIYSLSDYHIFLSVGNINIETTLRNGFDYNFNKKKIVSKKQIQRGCLVANTYDMYVNNLIEKGDSYKDNNEYKKAQEKYHEALQITGRILHFENSITYCNKAKILYKLGMLDEAEKYYKKAIELDPYSVPNHINYASFLHGTRKKEQAENHILIAKKLAEEQELDEFKKIIENWDKN
tara:strand:+ start:6741 stop:7736 length:996 start_codon:yes stop_codon:yes gene_type:complete